MATKGRQLVPWVAAGLIGIALAFTADALVNWKTTEGSTEGEKMVLEAVAGPKAVAGPNDAHVSRIYWPPRPGGPKGTPGIEAKPVVTPNKQAVKQATKELKARRVVADGPALADAARQGDLSAIDLLLKAGVKPDAADAQGRSALLAASGAGQVEAARKLLEAVADPNSSASDGRTPLMVAAAAGDLSMMALLLEFDAALDMTDALGHTPLAVAVCEGKVESAEWLFQQEAKAEPQCCNGTKTLTSHALEAHNPPLLNAVLQQLRPAEWTSETREALMDGIRRQEKPLIRALLAGHTTAPTPDGFRQPLLGYAIVWNKPDVLRLLLECGADPNTPLQSPVEPAFAKLVNAKVLRFYLEKEQGVTPLMVAAGLGDLESVQTLVEYGAKRNAYTKKSKWAALSFAARTQKTGVMQVLLGKSPKPEDQRVRVEISLASQTARVWKDDKVVMTTRVSTGRPGFRTPSGEFVITDKHRSRTSSIYHVAMPYFMRLSCSDVGMHAGVVPGHPASHGCIRLPYSSAVRLYRELEVGTLVTIR